MASIDDADRPVGLASNDDDDDDAVVVPVSYYFLALIH